eukprot:TRINITY_DN46074_c0_g1_i1.p1 TRINITY_DN46074_c0_g1~~TRINITY_DN46074_c0_g1_i1.p1  ORF type:complete len:298 (-),score=58.70 TRINITY_DN46074_c0_g1_i1:133-1026(-)
MAARHTGVLEACHFKRFAPLLGACRDYARYSGCRFFIRRFQELDDLKAAASLEDGGFTGGEKAEEMAAIAQAAPAVCEFGDRLRRGERGLVKELRQAFRVAMMEGIRNAMVSTCKELGVWPPCPIEYGRANMDGAASFLLIAQRLFDDEVQRRGWAGALPGSRRDPSAPPPKAVRLALTAVFIVDFASEVGAVLPKMPEEDEFLLEEFSAHAAEWVAYQKKTMPGRAMPEIPFKPFTTLAELDLTKSTLLATTGVASAAAIGIAASPVAAPLAVATTMGLAVGSGLAAVGSMPRRTY